MDFQASELYLRYHFTPFSTFQFSGQEYYPQKWIFLPVSGSLEVISWVTDILISDVSCNLC